MFGAIDTEHEILIRELRSTLQDSNASQAVTSDYHLLRFILARNGNVEEAKKMFETHLAWRKANNADAIREQVRGKPVQASSFPHADYFKPTISGCWNSIVDAGLARSGDVVHIECMGLKRQGELADTKETLDRLTQHLIGFFESRNMLLDELSTRESKLVRTIQLRDVSWISYMPGGTTFALVKKLIDLGMLNYPELAAFVVFVNPPSVFAAIFALVKVIIPADVDKKLRFLSGSVSYVTSELLRYVRPRNIVAWNRLVLGEQCGDDIQREIMEHERESKPWERVFQRSVGARSEMALCFALNKTSPQLTWSTTSTHVTGKIFYVLPQQEFAVAAKDIVVQSAECTNNTAKLPTNANEALVVLVLDNTSSWITAKQFQVKNDDPLYFVGEEQHCSQMFGPITAQHKQSIKELRSALKDNVEFQKLTETDLTSDYHLLRFVIARNSKTEDSKKMIEDHLAWRKEHNVREIRKQILGKRIEAATFPHAEYFKPTRTGSWNSVSDGGRSRSGDIVFIEAMGMDGGVLDDSNKDEMHKLTEHLIGFFEARNIQLETISTKEDKFIRTVQIRDLSAMSFIPKAGMFTAAKAFMNLGLLNYPEIGAFVLFVNPPSVFATLFSMLKPFIPGGVEKKLKFLSGSGDSMAYEMLKYVRPRSIVAWNRLVVADRTGDDIQREIEDYEQNPRPWEQVFDRNVGARGSDILCFTLNKDMRNLKWTLLSGGKLNVNVYFVAPEQEYGVWGKDVDVLVGKVDTASGTATLPSGANEALVIITLDNTSSWVNSKTITVRVNAS